jgi:hypothetical protein
VALLDSGTARRIADLRPPSSAGAWQTRTVFQGAVPPRLLSKPSSAGASHSRMAARYPGIGTSLAVFDRQAYRKRSFVCRKYGG